MRGQTNDECEDDLHRLGQLDGIYLGWSVLNTTDLANAPLSSLLGTREIAASE